MLTHKSLISLIHWHCFCSSDFLWAGPSGYLVTSSGWRALRGGAFSEGYSQLSVELGHSQTSTHQWLTSVEVSGRAPYWAEQCRLYPPKFSLGAHLPSVSCIPLLQANGYLSYKSQMHVPEEDLPASSVLPALPPTSVWAGCPLQSSLLPQDMWCPVLGAPPGLQ